MIQSFEIQVTYIASMTPTYKFAKDAELLSECIEKSSLYENLTIDIRDIPYYEVSEEDSLYYMHEADITQFFVKELRSGWYQ